MTQIPDSPFVPFVWRIDVVPMTAERHSNDQQWLFPIWTGFSLSCRAASYDPWKLNSLSVSSCDTLFCAMSSVEISWPTNLVSRRFAPVSISRNWYLNFLFFITFKHGRIQKARNSYQIRRIIFCIFLKRKCTNELCRNSIYGSDTIS